MILIDANVVIYYLVPLGPLTKYAEVFRSREKIWIAPSLIRHELLNVLAKYIKRGDLDRDEAGRAYRRGMSIVEISLDQSDPLAVFRMAAESGCTTYDLEYVWLAKELDIPFVTADQKVVDAYPETAIHFSKYA